MPNIVVSRSHKMLVRRLFEVEVPEVFQERSRFVRSRENREAGQRWRSCPGRMESIRSERASAFEAREFKRSSTRLRPKSRRYPLRRRPGTFVADALTPPRPITYRRRDQQAGRRHRSRRSAFAGHRKGRAERSTGRPSSQVGGRHKGRRCRDRAAGDGSDGSPGSPGFPWLSRARHGRLHGCAGGSRLWSMFPFAPASLAGIRSRSASWCAIVRV